MDILNIVRLQNCIDLIKPERTANTDFEQLINEHRGRAGKSDLYLIGLDFFALGYIYGKRSERKPKSKKPGGS